MIYIYIYIHVCTSSDGHGAKKKTSSLCTYTCRYIHVCFLQEAWAARVSELESEAKLRDEELAHTTQSMANAQDNLQVDSFIVCVYMYIHIQYI